MFYLSENELFKLKVKVKPQGSHSAKKTKKLDLKSKKVKKIIKKLN